MCFILNDVVAQFFLVVAAFHGLGDGGEIDHADAQTTCLIEVDIFVKGINIRLSGDHKQVVATHGATSVVVSL